uniref:Uncharacterized protein n=1 Tax=Siphoviridae sp. cttqT1 TaxID=2827961 RepID=A0A8S5TP34_9CAUD|nr:MAG TPA: hypothetical protein [Siphoviridae sp. cttqT1]
MQKKTRKALVTLNGSVITLTNVQSKHIYMLDESLIIKSVPFVYPILAKWR